MKKYEGNMKKYVGNMKIRTLPIYGPWNLEKFRVHPLISGLADLKIKVDGKIAIRVRSPQRHETCQLLSKIRNSLARDC